MNAGSRYKVGAVLLSLSLIYLPLVAQQASDSTSSMKLLQSASASARGGEGHQLLLDVVVTDKSGKQVSGLQQQDFTVLDDKQPAKILSFRAHSTAGMAPLAVDASTEVILVLDLVNVPYAQATYARQGIENFLKQNQGQLVHPVTTAVFTDKGLQMQTHPSIDGNAMAVALEKEGQGFRSPAVSSGFYGEEQRLKLSQDALDSLIAQERGKPGRKMVIWVSPGWPLLSGVKTLLSADQQQHIFHSVVALSVAMEQERMTLYSVDSLEGAGGTERTAYYQNFTKGLTKPNDAQLGDLGLQVLVTQTGGRAVFGNDTIASSINYCVADLNAFYTLVIDGAPSETVDDYHTLDVKVGSAGLKVKTRTGYYAQP